MSYGRPPSEGIPISGGIGGGLDDERFGAMLLIVSLPTSCPMMLSQCSVGKLLLSCGPIESLSLDC